MSNQHLNTLYLWMWCFRMDEKLNAFEFINYWKLRYQKVSFHDKKKFFLRPLHESRIERSGGYTRINEYMISVLWMYTHLYSHVNPSKKLNSCAKALLHVMFPHILISFCIFWQQRRNTQSKGIWLASDVF